MSDKFNISEDQLFEALQNAKSEVPTDAWANIETGISSRKKRLVWWKIAIPGAALLLFSVWAVITLQDTDDEIVDAVIVENHQSSKDTESDPNFSIEDQGTKSTSSQQESTESLNDESLVGKNATEISNSGTETINSHGDKLGNQAQDNLNKVEFFTEDKVVLYPKAEELNPIHPIISAYHYPFVINSENSSIDLPILQELPAQNRGGQSKNKVKSSQNTPNAPFEIGLELNALLLGNQFTVNPERATFVNKAYMDAINNTQKRSFGYQANLNIGKVFKSGIFVSSGFGYQRRVEEVGFNHIIKEAPRVEQNRGIVQYLELPKIGWDTVQYNGVNNYSLYRIPIKAGYDYALNTKWSARVNAGLNFVFLTEKQGKQIDETYLQLFDINESSIYRNNAMGWEAGLAVYRNFTRWNIAMELGYAKNINSILTEKSGVRVQPYQYGVSLKLNYLLGR